MAWLKKILLKQLSKKKFTFESLDLAKNTIVFAPHPDDETLGCGGITCEIIEEGGQVDIVFMTDGRNSHSNFMAPDKLKDIRTEEAVNASGMLGVKNNRVHFLNIPDGGEIAEYTAASDRIVALIKKLNPSQVFIPSAKEFPPDHSNTNIAVKKSFK